MNYRFRGFHRTLSFGTWPEVALIDARQKRDEARREIARGIDPGEKLKLDRIAAEITTAITFRSVAEEWLTKTEKEGLSAVTLKKNRWLLTFAFEKLGHRPIAEITPHELLGVLRKVEGRGRHESAKRIRAICSQVFRYGIATARADRDVAADLRGALIVPKVTHRPAITTPNEAGALLRAIDSFEGHPTTDIALKLAPHVFVRPGELRHAEWSDFDFVTARFENGSAVTASIVLGADGVRSLARRSFDDSLAVSANWSVLRTLCPANLLPADMPNDRMRFWDGWEFGDKEAQIGAHVLTVPVSEGKFISLDLQFVGGDQLEGCDLWDLPIDRVMRRYPETIDPVVKAMIDGRVEPITSHAIFDRPVADKWVDQRIAIHGDAAHSMRPSMGQGACQSVHDAGELAKSISRHGLTTEALLAYEAVRKPYVRMIVDVTREQPVAPELED